MRRYTTQTPPKTATEKKAEIVNRILKRYDFWDKPIRIISMGRRCGKSTMSYLLVTEAFTLAKLRNALLTGNPIKIKFALNERINRMEKMNVL